MKPVRFVGDALEAIPGFSEGAKSKAGYQIERVQRGLDPKDWKPMGTVGQGVREIRIRDETNAFRVIYVLPEKTLHWRGEGSARSPGAQAND